ncbi:MAG: potassium-transporting ATPase subunit KdpA [Micropepsaceae bacterium]
MTIIGWLQIGLVLALVLVTAPALGAFMARVFQGERTFLHPVLSPLESSFYRLSGVDPDKGQDWRAYTVAMLMFSLFGFLSLYVILRFQSVLPLNPSGFGPVSADLSFNTAVSFLTNTNWQSYGGETTMSHLSQMMGLTVHNFLSAATGIALALALTRAFANSQARELGNFWVDLTRCTLYVLLPISVIVALVLILLGMPQTLLPWIKVTTLEGVEQTLSLGPVASQIAIKHLGTNGGGFFNANSAHPFENPTAWTNLIETWGILVIPFALALTFGRMVGDRRQGYVLFAVMGVLLLAGIAATYAAEAAGNPLVTAAGIDPGPGNLEGKEVRFGTALSSAFAVMTTGTSCGAVISMHDSFTPLGGLVPLFMMQLGEILPGGVGSGLYGLIIFAILSVFVAGLMVGRTPEYLGKKIGAREMKLAVLAILILPAAILGFTAIAVSLDVGRAGPLNTGPHGYSEILYAFTSAAANNGSAFAGLTANTPFYNVLLGIGMLLGRFAYIVPMMAIAGSVATKIRTLPAAGTFPTDNSLFVGLVCGVVLIMGGLQFFTSLALGPIVEHFLMSAGHLSP